MKYFSEQPPENNQSLLMKNFELSFVRTKESKAISLASRSYNFLECRRIINFQRWSPLLLEREAMGEEIILINPMNNLFV